MKRERTALILGATGGIGGSIAEALLRRGWGVRALVRDPDSAAKHWNGRLRPVTCLKGDAMRREDVVGAAAGVDAIVHAVNPPGYRDWERLVLPMIDNTIAAARVVGGARIVLPGTNYNFDPARSPIIDEDTPQRPLTRKGKVRVALEERLAQAVPDVPSLIVRAGDFFGPQSGSSWFSQGMIKPGRPVSRVLHPGKGVGHSWAYLPDLAEAVARLMELGDALLPFERLQFEGHWDADGSALTAAVRRVVGRDVPERRFPWWLMRALAPFGGFSREVVEIEDYWRHPVQLDNSRLTGLLGAEPRTQLDEAVRATLADLRCLDEATTDTSPRLVSAMATAPS